VTLRWLASAVLYPYNDTIPPRMKEGAMQRRFAVTMVEAVEGERALHRDNHASVWWQGSYRTISVYNRCGSWDDPMYYPRWDRWT